MQFTKGREVPRLIIQLVSALAALLLTACSCRFLSIGDEASKALGVEVGLKVVTTTELVAMVVADHNDRTKADHIHMTPLPGFGGPEVLKTIQVPKQWAFEVTGVRRSDSKLCSEVFATLRATPSLEGAGLEVWVQLDELPGGQRYSFDPVAFKTAGER